MKTYPILQAQVLGGQSPSGDARNIFDCPQLALPIAEHSRKCTVSGTIPPFPYTTSQLNSISCYSVSTYGIPCHQTVLTSLLARTSFPLTVVNEHPNWPTANREQVQ